MRLNASGVSVRNFFRLASGVDVTPTAHQLALRPNLWNENRLRTEHPGSAHTEADDIWLLFNKLTSTDVLNDLDVVPYRAWGELVHLRGLVLDVMRRVEGVQLGRVVVTRLKPGAKISPHADGGKPTEYYTRYQIVLQSQPGCIFRCGDERVEFKTGDVWWFNNRIEHEVLNESQDDRIVCIIDVRRLD